MENEFAKDLTVMVQEYGPRTKEILARLLENPAISPNVFSEALRWLGRMEDKRSHEARRWILEKALTSPAPQTRNGALIGLSSMDDPHAVQYLETAMQDEKIDLVRRSMKKVVEQLTNR
jgi:HEAT repeat protein